MLEGSYLYSHDGWGCQHVNQDLIWVDPDTTEPAIKGGSATSPVLKPINNGTEWWEASLRNGGQSPSKLWDRGNKWKMSTGENPMVFTRQLRDDLRAEACQRGRLTDIDLTYRAHDDAQEKLKDFAAGSVPTTGEWGDVSEIAGPKNLSAMNKPSDWIELSQTAQRRSMLNFQNKSFEITSREADIDLTFRAHDDAQEKLKPKAHAKDKNAEASGTSNDSPMIRAISMICDRIRSLL